MSTKDALIANVANYALYKEILTDKKKLLKCMPKNAFGVFVTVKRNSKVHGCQGYWNNQFANLEPNNLYEHLLRVAHAAMWLDDRRFNFPSIETENKIVIEIDYMYLPIKKNNRQFSNVNLGIIIQDNEGRRATYLPGVFPNESLDYIVESIKMKAGIIGNQFSLFSYKIKQVAFELKMKRNRGKSL